MTLLKTLVQFLHRHLRWWVREKLADVFTGLIDPFAGLRSKHFQYKYFVERTPWLNCECKKN